MKSAKQSAGIILYRRVASQIEVLLAHMGGPFWAKKDEGSWSIPKGEFENEPPLDAAVREFHEETGIALGGNFLELTPVKQPSGKVVFAWALEGDCDASMIKSNTFTIEWPRGSGVMKEFPEIDRAAWFTLGVARQKLLKGQVPLLQQLSERLGVAIPSEESPKPSEPKDESKDSKGTDQLSFL